MRKELGKHQDKRLVFTASVDRYGTKRNWHGFTEKTILLKDVRFKEGNGLATDHIWFTVGKTIEALGLKEKDKIQFEARVGEYEKGYINFRGLIDESIFDYKLNRPTKFLKI